MQEGHVMVRSFVAPSAWSSGGSLDSFSSLWAASAHKVRTKVLPRCATFHTVSDSLDRLATVREGTSSVVNNYSIPQIILHYLYSGI